MEVTRLGRARDRLPLNPPAQTRLRLRLPRGWKLVSASVNAKPLSMCDDETIELAGLKGHIQVRAVVDRG